MKQSGLRPVIAMLAIVFCFAAANAADYILDTDFNPTFGFSGSPDWDAAMSAVTVQPDGKVLVGGMFTSVNGEACNFITRLNPDGTRDATFNSPLVPASGMLSYVDRIKVLAGGKILIGGQLKIGSEYTMYARLNADGSLDASMPNYGFASGKLEPLPNGQFVVCGGRLVNDEDYWISHRLNADGSIDPTFRVTIGQGSCKDIKVQPDGKILIAGMFYVNGSSYLDSVQRLNPDGSRDESFDIAMPSAGIWTGNITLLPDGKIIVPYSWQGTPAGPTTVQRFNTDGSLDTTFSNCGANDPGTALPESDGTVTMSGCRRWATGDAYQFGKITPDGDLVPGLDRIDTDGPVTEIVRAPDGKYYVRGFYTKVSNTLRFRLACLRPYSVPIKPKFDFDGDGRSDVSVFRPSDGYWYLHRSTEGNAFIRWGLATDIPIATEIDFDNRADITAFRGNGVWHNLTASFQYYPFVLDTDEGDKRPFVGDFDGDRKQDFAVRHTYRGSVKWLVTRNSERGYSYVTDTVSDETPDDVPVVGDFDGDSRDEIGYFRDGDWHVRDYGSGAPARFFHWGATGDIPAPGDYDADGTTDYAVFRPSNGVWWVNLSTGGVFAVQFGQAGDIPVAADYDGDSRTDVAIFRNGEWWQYRSNGGIVHAEPWGTAGDIPIPAQVR